MARLNLYILLTTIIMVFSLTNSLKCYRNDCDDEDGCTSQGQGMHWNCLSDPDYTYQFCIDRPRKNNNELLDLAMCAGTSDPGKLVPGCGPEYEEFTGSKEGCICFEDLCNNHFKPDAKFLYYVKENGAMGDPVE